MRRRRGLGCSLLLAFAIVTLIAGLLYLGPYRGPRSETFVEIEHGMSSRQIAAVLADEGVVRSRWAFLVVRLLHPRARLQAGEYRFGAEQTSWRVFDKIRRGDVFYQDLTVPEGSNMFDIAALLANADAVRPDEFLKAAAEAATIHDLDRNARTLEGYLFPSTYRVTHSTTAPQLCRMMTTEFRKQWQTLTGTTVGLDPHRVVTLASLVEKETGVPEERALVAAVFVNRLQLHMPLQCDPTTVYAALLEKRYTGVIHRSDLASGNPYNTYAHVGLPPGPISNPGLPSLKAALHPGAVPYLYFVARGDGSGGHHFSSSLAEHEKAVETFRKTAR